MKCQNNHLMLGLLLSQLSHEQTNVRSPLVKEDFDKVQQFLFSVAELQVCVAWSITQRLWDVLRANSPRALVGDGQRMTAQRSEDGGKGQFLECLRSTF